MHPRNRHQSRYDFAALIAACPELAPFAGPNPAGDRTIDFADPAAVRVLNRALLQHHYGIRGWDIPPGFLCPPIPGRADYVHHLADLLGERTGAIPRGGEVAILDIGTGAGCIYPLLGQVEYQWNFVGTEVDRGALTSARAIVAANRTAVGRIELRWQRSRQAIFDGVVTGSERFAAVMCNPPFHASAAEAAAGTRRKVRALAGGPVRDPVLNFGGQASELWCVGGETAFVGRMIAESARRPALGDWFTSLISKRENLPAIHAALAAAGAREVRTVEMRQGQKTSRFVAWTFRPAPQSRRAAASVR